MPDASSARRGSPTRLASNARLATGCSRIAQSGLDAAVEKQTGLETIGSTIRPASSTEHAILDAMTSMIVDVECRL